MGKNTPSLRDVAQTAGVSPGRASCALSNKSSIIPTTHAVVLKAAAQIGHKLQLRILMTVASKASASEKELMGALTVSQLYERVVNRDCPPITIVIGTRLILRASVSKVVSRQGELA